MSKIYRTKLKKFDVRKIVAQKSMGDDNYRLNIWQGEDNYILSNPCASNISPRRFAELESKLRQAETDKKEIEILFVKRFGRKWINDIL